MIRHAIFDLDGTLVDSAPGIGWSVNAALAACGLPPANCDLKRLIGPPIRAILARASDISDPAALGRLERAFRRSYDSEGWRKTSLQPGAAEMLDSLRSRGIALWLATNKPRLSTGMILGELAIGALFQETVCRDSRTPPFESKGEMLLDLIERRGLERQECIFIGDTREDAGAASAAGISCVLVPHGYGDEVAAGAASPGRLSGWDDLINCVNRRARQPGAGEAAL